MAGKSSQNTGSEPISTLGGAARRRVEQFEPASAVLTGAETRMPTNAQYKYFESRILSADPLELIEILYEAALESVENAIGHLREGNIAGRSKAISRAHAILVELGISLNRDADPTVAANLVELYDYMERRLNEANFHQIEPPLAEVAKLLGTLREGWANCRKALLSPPPAAPPEEEAEYAGRSWTA